MLGVGPGGELEAMAGELGLGGGAYRIDALAAVAGLGRIEAARVVGEGVGDQRAALVRNGLVPADTLYLGFGLEGVTGAGTPAQIMDRAIGYLLR